MNKRALSPVLIAIIASMSLLSSTAIPQVFAQTAALGVQAGPSPGNTLAAGNPGDTFTVQVLISEVSNLVGYDVTLHYNNLALTATSVDFGTNTAFCLDAQGVPHSGGCRPTHVFVQMNQLDTGIIRSAQSLLSGDTMNVDALSGALPVFIVTFTVVARLNSPLHIFPDDECACQSIAAIVGGVSTPVAHMTNDGAFFAEPNILLVGAYANASFAGASPKVVHLKKGETSTTLQSTISLASNETVAGFAFVVFDMIGPHGATFEVVSNELVLLPGDLKTVSALFPVDSNCAISCGTYVIFVTLWRGGVDSDTAPFQQATGFHFRVNP